MKKLISRRNKKAIKENQDRKKLLAPDHIDGHPWSGTPENLAQAQSQTWGHGQLVDPNGYSKMVDQAVKFSQGKADSPLQIERNQMKISKKQLKKILEQIEMEVELEQAPINSELPQSIPGVEAKENAWAGGDNLELDVDQPKASGAESNIKGQEFLSITESELRKFVRSTILKELNTNTR